MAYLLFQGSPKYYLTNLVIQDFEQRPRLVTRYAKDMVSGNEVLGRARDKAEVFPRAEIRSSPKILSKPPDIDYCIDTSCIQANGW